MATIVTVHGTFASGPTHGQKWWQIGSAFLARIEHFVEAEDGPVRFEPFVWDGKNSETSRRKAGTELSEFIGTLEERAEPHVLIGHSHGGSVISAALLKCAQKKRTLPCLRRWITVGTPFIEARREPFLFSRLGVLGRAMYLTLVTFSVLALLAMGVQWDERDWQTTAYSGLIMMSPLIAFYILLRVLEWRRSLRYNSRITGFASQAYGARWLSLWQEEDEAILGLRAVRNVELSLFPRSFAVTPISLISILFVPAVCFLTISSPETMRVIAAQVAGMTEPGVTDEIFTQRGADIFENAAVLLVALFFLPSSLFISGEDLLQTPEWFQWVLLFMVIGLLIAVAVLVTLTISAVARLVSYGLSVWLNPITTAQFRAMAFGSDTHEDIAFNANEFPTWMGRRFPPLPVGVGGEIKRWSDAAISGAIPKFRSAVNHMTALSPNAEKSDVISDYLTWEELIHTSYFKLDRFAKLTAYAICQNEGFRPSQAFREDPEFGFAKAWYDALTMQGLVEER